MVQDVGGSLVEADGEETARDVLETARRRGVPVGLPVDAVVAEGPDSPSGRVVGIREIPATHMGLDIGPLTVERFAAGLKGARTIVWNGPMGVFEKAPFAEGTLAVARAVAAGSAFSVIGGGGPGAPANASRVAARVRLSSAGGGGLLACPWG